MPFSRFQQSSKLVREQADTARRPQTALRSTARRKAPYARPSCSYSGLQKHNRGLEAHISQLSLQEESLQPRCSHIVRAKWRRGSSDDEEPDPDDDDEAGRSSRGSNNYAEDDEDDDDDDDVDADPGMPSVQDPTTRLFQMMKEKDYNDDVEVHSDDEDDNEGIQSIDNRREVERRGKKRKATYEQANASSSLGLEDDSEEDFSGTEADPEDLADEDDINLDDIAGSVFDDEDDDDDEDLDRGGPAKMPTKAKQHRPETLESDRLSESLPLDDEGLMEDDQYEPIVQYAEPPVRKYNLADLLLSCGIESTDDALGSIEVTSIETEWEHVKQGSLYVPLSREGLNDYYAVGTAIDQGAVAVLSEEELCQVNEEEAEVPIVVVPDKAKAASKLAEFFHDRPSTKMTVVGVTGSRGKTTTSWLIRGIFEEMQLITGMVGSLEHSIAVDKMTIDGNLWKPDKEDTTLARDCSTAFHVTPYEGKYPWPVGTPNMVQIQTVMGGMADRGATACVYECGLQAANSGWSEGVDMDVGVYLGFTKEEIDAVNDIQVLLNGQEKFFSSLKDPLRQTAVINMDDDYYEDIVKFAKEVPTVTFSVNDDSADVFVIKSSFGLWETDVTIQTPAGKLQLTSALIGRHNLPNILAAVATGLALTIDDDGIPLRAIVNGIRATEIIPGRCEVIDEEQDFGVVVDAANTPESLSRLLDSIRETGPRKILLVFGCEGNTDKKRRPFMGEIAHYKADLVILTNHNPRGENPNQIIADIVAGYPDDILSLNAMQAYPPGFLQDPGRVQFEALEFAWHNCYEFRRYVMEDRWTAIRWAIGTAAKKDVVVVAGKGAQDYQEYIFEGKVVRSWFDDRVECRNALSKVQPLKKFDGEIDRKELPWMETDERPDNLRVYNVAAD